MIGNSNDETATRAKTANFPHKLLLTNRQVANLCKAFVNNSLTKYKTIKNVAI